MNQDDYKWIDSYFDGTLDEGEKAAFQKRLEEDAAFREAYNLRKSMDIFLKGQSGKAALKKDLESLNTQFFNEEQDQVKKSKVVNLRPRMWRFVAAAAAILLLIFAINYFLPRQNLYQQYADVGKMTLVQKGPETALGKAEIAYNSKDFETAAQELQLHLSQNPEDIQAKYFLGLAAIESDQFDRAMEIFTELDAGNSAYKPFAKWWMAMVHLKSGNLEKCREVLQQIPSSNSFYPKAIELLQQLN